MMQNMIKRITGSMLPLLLVVFGILCASCSNDNIVIGEVDETQYILSGESLGFLRDVNTSYTEIAVEVSGVTNRNIYLGLTKATGKNVNATVEVNTTLVDAYNEAHSTTYAAFPAAQVSITGNGALSVAQWKIASDPLTVSLTKGTLVTGSTYLLPITVKDGATVPMTSGLHVLYYVVKVIDDATSASTDKYITGTTDRLFRTMCYIEVGNASANLLNVGAYALEDGTPFFDIAVLFAANIKYEEATGEVSLVYNESVGHILRNRDTYIKPLQDKGIKVILGVVGNWDMAGVANLQGEALRNYAMQCKIAIDTYGLDGIDFDDEWSAYSSATGAAYTAFMASKWYPEWAASGTKMARLIIETRRLLGPEKIITLFEYGYGRNLPANVDGVHMVDIIDYSMYAIYQNTGTMNTSYVNMPAAKYSPKAVNVAGGNAVAQMTAANLRTTCTNIKNGSYGFLFFYDLRNVIYQGATCDGVTNGCTTTTVIDMEAYLSNASEPLFGQKVKLVEPLRPHW
jgi:hypothetical protein